MDIYHNPVRVLFGYGALDRLKGLVEETGARRVLVLTRGGEFEQTQPAQQIKEQLAEKIAMWIPYTVSNPDLADIAPVYQAASELDYDLVVAVGGGSVMDTGKFLSCFRGMGLQGVAELRQAVVSHSYCENHRRCPFIGISTTSGTSSELTPWAAIWDREKGLKYSIDHPSIFAYAAIIDPVLTLALPRRATVSTALDALCHATESYWSKPSNAISRIFSLRAIETITKTLPKLAEDLSNRLLREQMAYGAMCAGMAFSTTRTTACHSISYPLTLTFGLEHGIAAAATLPSVLVHNQQAIIDKERFFHAFGGSQSAEQAKAFLLSLYQQVDARVQLSQYGASPADLQEIVSRAYTKGRMDNNPVAISPEDLFQMLKELL